MSGIALILAGHGSHVSANTAGVVWDCVDRLRQLGVADEVTACFWKEAPAFSHVLDTVEADDVVVVPLFTARGYFTGQVLPGEMGLDGPVTSNGERRIHLTPPIGEHRILDAIVDERLRQVFDRFDLPAQETAITVIGHGTPRNQHSRDTARHQADRIRSAGFANEVVAVYLDDDPDIPSVYRSTSSPNIIALPYFLADGSHVGVDVPHALGITGSGTAERVNGRTVFTCDPVGDHASIVEVILALARDTGLPLEPTTVAGKWERFPAAGKRALRQQLDAGRILQFGQVLVSPERVWHEDDGLSQPVTSAGELRSLVREAPFRPLSTSADLPGGWHVDLQSPEDARAVIETVYPGLLADWAAREKEQFAIESLEALAKRQAGMFKDIHKLSSAVIKKTMQSVCAGCVRQPSWWNGAGASDAALPCRSACNLWLSTARKIGDAL
ncbi:MAG: DR2241 family protein [Chloroflexi bacterium]|nr:DR2241 family protein [Chloroflexota bacterium]